MILGGADLGIERLELRRGGLYLRIERYALRNKRGEREPPTAVTAPNATVFQLPPNADLLALSLAVASSRSFSASSMVSNAPTSE